MKDFTILVAVAIFGQIVAFTIAANFSERLSEDADTLAQEEGADQIAPSATDISSIPPLRYFEEQGLKRWSICPISQPATNAKDRYISDV